MGNPVEDYLNRNNDGEKIKVAPTNGVEQENESSVVGGGFDPTRYVPGVAGDLLTGLLFAYETALQAGQGAVGIVDELVKGFETGEYLSGIPQSLAGQNILLQVAKAKAERKTDIYENYVADMVKKGASEKLIKEQDPTNTVKMEKLTDWFEKTLPAPAVDSETGEVLDYISLYGRGEIIKGTDALIGDIAGSFPSLLISRVPVVGPAILGASTYMGEFESELIKRAKDPNFNLEEDRDNLVQNALITGASDFVWETVGGSMLNKIPGMKLGKEKVVDIIKESPKQLLKKAGLGFLSEFTTEGATGVTTELADVLSFGDDVKPIKDYFRTFFKDGFIGGFLGASSSGASGLSAQNKEVIHEYVSPQTYKQDQFKLSTEILTLEQDKQKAKGKDVEYFETKIQELRDKKKANKENLNNFFNSLTKAQKVEYASNIDKQNDAINIIGNKDYSKEAQEMASKDLAKYTEANNKFFKDTEVNYIADFENYAKRTISNAAKLRKARGVFGFDNKNLNLVELNTAEEIKEVNDRLPGFNEADGLFLGEDASGKPTMYINKKVAAEKGATNVLGHEYLHAITSMAFKESGIGNENLGKAAKAFTEYLKSTGNSQVVEDIEERLAENYGGLDADGNIIRDENGLVKTSKKEQQEEYFNLFSDLISKEKIKNVEEKSGGIKNAFRQLFVGLGFSKVDFQDGQQVFDYLVDYNANMERAGILGKFVSKRIAKTKMKGLEATAAEKAVMDLIEKQSKSGYNKTERDNRLDAIGEKSTKAEWDAGGSDRAISDMYMSGDLEAIVRNNLSSDLKNLPNYSEEDFISETIGELMPHINNFNPLRKEDKNGKKNPVYEYLIKAGVKESDISSLSLGQAKKRLSDYASKETTSEADKININKTIEKYGLSGWIRGQVSNKIGEVLKKKKATTETFTVDTTDEKVKETVESDDDLQDLQEEDLSVAAQAKKKAKAERREEKGMEADVEYSTFRRALKVKGKQGLSDNIVDNVKQAVVKTMATERTTPDSDKFIANIKKSFLTELKKPIQDMMGKKDDFTNFLKTNREAIIAALPTSTLVQMERNVDPADRVFTVEVKRNLNPTETKDAIANNLLPKDTNINSGPTLYNKRMPSEGEFLRYFSPPLYVPSKKDPNKSVRSGLKGTRKDTLAEQMGIELAFDATMEVVQSPDVAERRSLVTNTDFIDSGVEELARSIGRGVDVKFSRSNPAEVGIKMDLALDNVNTDAYLDIRFSKSSRDAYIKRLVKNRPDLKGQEEQYVDSVFDWLETTDIKKRSKYEKMAMHYMAKGYLILPEDGYKVIEAERLATIKKIDPFSVGNPSDIIEKYAGTVKVARTNPDTVKEFSNKKELSNGVVTYDVEQTKKGQLAVREVADTHFGKKFNSWCLAARSNRAKQEYGEFDNLEEADRYVDYLKERGYETEVFHMESDGTWEVYGDLMMEPGDPRELDEAFIPWKNYQQGGKGYQIVFTDGKLSHFRDGSGQYWDKMDKPSGYISKKLNDIKTEDGFIQERELNINTGEEVLGKKTKTTGNQQDGTYTNITIENDEVGDGKVEQVTGFNEVYDRVDDLEDSGYEVSDPEVVQEGDSNTTVYEIQYFDPRATLNTDYKAVELKEVREDGELTYQKKLTKYPGESHGTETKYSGDIKTITNTESGPESLKKGGSPRWELETALERIGKVAGVNLKLDEYTETTFVNDYKQAPESPWGGDVTNVYDRVGSKHTVKGELNGKNTTIEMVESVDANKDSNITKVKVNGKTVYTAPKVDNTGIKFSKSKSKLGIPRDGLVETGLGIQNGIIFDKATKKWKLHKEVIDYIKKKTPKSESPYYPSSELLGYLKDFYNDIPDNAKFDNVLQGKLIGKEMTRISRLVPKKASEGHLYEAAINLYSYSVLKSIQPNVVLLSKKQAAKKLVTILKEQGIKDPKVSHKDLPDVVLWDGKALFTVETKRGNARGGSVVLASSFQDIINKDVKALNALDNLDPSGDTVNEAFKKELLDQISGPLSDYVEAAKKLGEDISGANKQIKKSVYNKLGYDGGKGANLRVKVAASSRITASEIVNYYKNGKFKPMESDLLAHNSKGTFTLGVDKHGLYEKNILPRLTGNYGVTISLKANTLKSDKTKNTISLIFEIQLPASDIKGEYADGRKVDASDLKLQNKKQYEKVLKNVEGFKLSKSQSTSKAMELGQLTNKDTEAVGMSTFDFDETLIIDGDNFITATRGDDVVKITSSQWPLVGDAYIDEGYTFDFSDFVNVRGGVDGPLLQKMKNQISKYGVKNVFVLTARPAESATAIQGWLESKGINIPLENITGLGNSSGAAKAQWMLDKFAEGYNDMYFVDDALPNVDAVKNVLDQLDAKSNVQLAKVMFSKSKYNSSQDPYSFVDFKTVPKEIVNSKSYKNWIKSLEGIKLFHGTVINPSDISKRGTNHSLNWFLVGGNNNEQAISLAKNIERDFDGEPENSVLSIDASKLAGRILPDSDFIGPSDAMGISSEFAGKIQALEDKYKASTRVQSMIQIPAMYAEFLDIITEYNPMSGFSQTLFDKNGKLSVNTAVVVIGGLKPNQLKVESISDPKTAPKFSKNSLRKNKAVQNVLDQLDIKSKVQQAKIKFSKTASQKLNDMIERKKGIDSDEIISSAAARRRGENINKFQVFVPPTAEDFSGLLYYFAGKGKQGDADLAFMKEFLLDPLSRGERDIAIKKQSLIRGYNELKNKNWKAAAKIKEMAGDTPYTKGTAVRVYLWNQDKTDIPGLSDKEVQELVDIVKNDPELIAYADGLRALVGDSEGKYITPSNDWVVETIAKDLQDATSRVGRKKFLAEFIENADAFFSKDNLNKMEAAYGKDFRESLEDMLYRIKTGQNRPSGTDASTKKWMNWLNNSVGAIMFFNTKSAVLQLMSTVNYLNWSDNNFLLAGKAFANQKQFWSDFSMLWNSDFLKQRRFGLSTDINEAEIANAAAGAKNKATAVLAYLLKKGFLPTQIADSFAISSGGAAFYRNRVNSYVKQGMDQKAAEEKAMTDFREITEENQQSSRPDRISKQQASPLGRVILAFQNTPMQYARIIKKSVADIVAGRGDLKTHVSKIIFYGGVQSLIFGAMQNALFALAFDDEEDDKKLTKTELEKKQKKRDTQYERTLNTMLDSLLNGSGLTGRVLSTVKNVIFKFLDEKDKGWNSDMGNVAIEAANISPPLGSKLRKIKKAGDVYDWNAKVISEMDVLDINNPLWESGANAIEATTNVPAARAIKKLESIREAFNQNNETWQRIAVAMGWSQWDLGIEGLKKQAVQETKEYLKKKKKDEKAKSKKRTVKKSSPVDIYLNRNKPRKNQASKFKGGEYRCTALTQDLSQCKNRTDNSSRKCFLHN